MHSFLFKAATLLLAPIMAAAIETGFLLASGAGFFVAISDSDWSCDNLESPQFTLKYTNGADVFHVTSDTGSVCGVAQWDAYKDCETCTNYGLYVAGSDDGKAGFCYPVTSGARTATCQSDAGEFFYDEYMYCDIWNAPAAC